MHQQLLGNLSEGILFILSAPAGTGKTTLVRMLQEEFSCVIESVSYTTRPIRPGEVEGRDYHFLTHAEFEKRRQADDFLEYAQVFNHDYGTSRSFVREQQAKGKHVVLVIDTQGAMQLKGKIKAVSIFLKPPSIEELKARLFKRKTDSVDVIEKRLACATREIALSTQYDYQIVNDHLETAYQVLRSILIAEEHRAERQ